MKVLPDSDLVVDRAVVFRVVGEQTRVVERAEAFAVDAPIVWRSRPDGDVGFVFACRVLADDPDAVAVVQPTGAPILRRVGRRGGPNGRSLLPGTWNGSYHQDRWHRPAAVRLHPVGRAYSVIRTWLEDQQRFQGWYVNLEQPWSRTPIGFDSRDDTLDVVVSDDLGDSRLKDEDELDFAVEVGKVTPSDAHTIRATAVSAMDDVANRRWPFQDAAWRQLRPRTGQPPPGLPAGWDQTF